MKTTAQSTAAAAPSNSAPLHLLLPQVALILGAISAGSSWSTAQIGIENRLRSGVQAITFAVLRQLGLARALRKVLAKKAPSTELDALLTTALALLCAQREGQAYEGAVFAPFVIVDQTVQAAKSSPKWRNAAGFINACLRRFLREQDALLQSLSAQPEAMHNHPAWWVKQLKNDWPAHWQAILSANLQPAPLTLRMNESICTIEQMERAGAATQLIAFQSAKRVAASGLELPKSLPVAQLPGYEQGWFSVQDAAAQLAAPLLMQALEKSNAQPLRILDACAAPGGKTSHLLEWAAVHQKKIQVLALDVDAKRCERIDENLARLGLLDQSKVQIKAANALDVQSWHDGQAFDGILLDAPCSASGIVRRHPDIAWLRRASDIAELAALQKQMLAALWPLLKPGGALLYCTCSVFKAEGQAQIDAFLTHNTQALSLPAPGHLLPLKSAPSQRMPDNLLGDHDGFFYALLRKQA